MIAKAVNHLTVDILFRRALPELQFFDLSLPPVDTADWRYEALEPTLFPLRDHVGDTLGGAAHLGWMLREHAGLWQPDLWIVDHEISAFIGEQVGARRMVWYCHADYSATTERHRSFVRHWLERLGDARAIYPTEDKRLRNESLRSTPGPALVLPLAVPDEAFVLVESGRNGRAVTVRNAIGERLKMYQRDVFEELFRAVVSHLTPDIYGSNRPDTQLFDASIPPPASATCGSTPSPWSRSGTAALPRANWN